jgi:hypothetical protein
VNYVGHYTISNEELLVKMEGKGISYIEQKEG